MPTSIPGPAGAPPDGIEARIAHFLRVSEDPAATQAERDTAGQEADRLLARHAIDRLTLDVDGAKRAEREPIERATVPVAGGRSTVALDVVLGLIAAAQALGLVAHYRDRRQVDRYVDGPDACSRSAGARRRGSPRSFSGYGRAPGYAAGLRSSGSAHRAVTG